MVYLYGVNNYFSGGDKVDPKKERRGKYQLENNIGRAGVWEESF